MSKENKIKIVMKTQLNSFSTSETPGNGPPQEDKTQFSTRIITAKLPPGCRRPRANLEHVRQICCEYNFTPVQTKAIKTTHQTTR